MNEVTDGSGITPDSGQPKLLTQEEVNALVGREKHAASERTRRELEAAHQAELAKLQSGSQQQAAQSPANADDLYRQVMERLTQETQATQAAREKAEHEAFLSKRADSYLNKMNSAQDMPDDFQEVMKDFDLDNLSEIAFLAEEVDNTPHVMYELAKNPLKAGAIMSLVGKSTKEARKEIKKLSDSIVKNQQAAADHIQTQPPLSQLKPSKAGADTGEMTLQDFKSADWLKG